jgi:hypothetical protein
MWETAVRVERTQAVDAAPERVWSLLGSTASWSSLRPGRSFAFDVLGSPTGTGRLRCLFGAIGPAAGCAVFEVREEPPGQMICLRRRDSRPSEKQVYTLSVVPRKRGTTICVAVSQVVPRESRADWKARWRKALKVWLDALQAVTEGRAPWPGAEMPADVKQACYTHPVPEATESVSTAVLIGAPVGVVWEAVWAPETARIVDPAHVIYAGHVSGTPEREVGEMQYSIRRWPDGRLTAAVYVVSDLAYQQSALIKRVGPPYAQTHRLLAPTPGGTRLEMAWRWPEAELKDRRQDVRSVISEHLQEIADGYKTMIEEAAERPSRPARERG